MNSSRRPIFLGVILAIAFAIAVSGAAGSLGRPLLVSDVNVTLRWAAFDDDHAAVEYDVEGDFTTPARYLPIGCPVGEVRLIASTGEDVTADSYTSCRAIVDNQTFRVNQFFYDDFRDRSPERLEVTIGAITLMPVGDGDVGRMPLVGTYVLEGEFEMQDNLSARMSGAVKTPDFSLEVRRVDFSPSLTKVDACLTLPDTRDWMPDAYIVLGPERLPIDEWFIPNFREPGILDQRERCYTFIAFSGLSNAREPAAIPVSVSFAVKELALGVPDCVDARDLKRPNPGLCSWV